MIPKIKEKQKAIKLRKQGFSYREILEKVPVAKSTLSLWLREIGLSQPQKQRLTKKRLECALKGAHKRREQRIAITRKLKEQARSEIKYITKRDLWMIGIALYWAEGSKEKENNGIVRGSRVDLGNSDPELVKIFLKWLLIICKIPKSEIRFRIYLHETSRHRLNEVREYWRDVTGFKERNFQKVTWKKNKINTKRKNIRDNYFGLLAIRVRASTNLNRKIAGWTEEICNKV